MIFDKISFNNLDNSGFDAIQFSLMGMAIVFAGLVVIAVYIILLPKLLELTHKKKKEKQPADNQSESQTDKEDEVEILLAIAAAAHLHINFPEGNERITWKSHGDLESPWQVSGRMHSLGVRKRTNKWIKK